MSPPVIHTDPFGLLKFSSFGSFQLRAVATPAVLCCGVQGNLGFVPPRAAQGERLVVTCDVSLVRGRKRPFGYVWSSVTLVIGIIALIIGRGMTLDGLAIFLVAFLGPWVILQLAFFLDCFRIRTKILRLIRSVRSLLPAAEMMEFFWASATPGDVTLIVIPWVVAPIILIGAYTKTKRWDRSWKERWEHRHAASLEALRHKKQRTLKAVTVVRRVVLAVSCTSCF